MNRGRGRSRTKEAEGRQRRTVKDTHKPKCQRPTEIKIGAGETSRDKERKEPETQGCGHRHRGTRRLISERHSREFMIQERGKRDRQREARKDSETEKLRTHASQRG